MEDRTASLSLSRPRIPPPVSLSPLLPPPFPLPLSSSLLLTTTTTYNNDDNKMNKFMGRILTFARFTLKTRRMI